MSYRSEDDQQWLSRLEQTGVWFTGLGSRGEGLKNRILLVGGST